MLVSAAANNGRMAMDIEAGSALSQQINRLSDDIIGQRAGRKP